MASPDKTFYVAIDLQKYQLKQARIHNLASAPGSPATGQAYFDTTLGQFGVYNGSSWVYMGSGSGDVSSNTSSSVDGEMVLFNSTTGKSIKRSTLTGGLLKSTSGVPSIATAGTDYLTAASSNTLTNKTFDANGTGNAISNIEVADFASGVVDTDLSSVSGSDDTLASAKAIKTYVDNSVQGLSWKQNVRAATTANITLSGAQTIDGVSVVAGERVLVKDQSTASGNGIYVVASGSWTRATDADSSTELVNATTYVSEGTANADTVWTCTNNATITVGTTNLVFAQVNGGTVPAASTSVAGKVQLADTSTTDAHSSTTTAVTPASLTNHTKKYTTTIGDNSSTSIAVTHSFGTKAVLAQAYLVSDDSQIECDIVATSTSQVTFGFAVAPASGAVRVVVVG